MKNPSNALRQFRKDIRKVGSLANLESRYALPIRPRSRGKSEALIAGSFLLLSGLFENYLGSLFNEAADDLLGRIGRSDDRRLPKEFEANNIYNYVQWVVRARIVKADKIVGIQAHAAAVAATRINPESFDRTNANPNSSTIKELFGDIGVKDCFSAIEKEYNKITAVNLPRTLIEQKVDAFVRARNDFAHTGGSSSVTRSDLQEAMEFIRIVAESINMVIHAHISAIR